MRPELARKSLHKRASFSKAIPRCPANRRGIPRLISAQWKGEKAAGIRRLLAYFDRLKLGCV
jgi:hypothetical protein